MALINLTIAKTPTEEHIRCWNAKIVKTDPEKANIFTCIITSDNNISLGDEVKFYDIDNNYTFGGYIQKPVNNTGYVSLEVADYSIVLSQNTANESFESKAPEEIIEYLIDNYTDLTFVNNLTITNADIDKLIISDSYLLSTITDMMELFNGAFYVDKEKNFYLSQNYDTINSKSIINGVDALSGGWKTDNNKKAEKVVVKGATIKQRTTETLSGTGTEFTTAYTPNDVEISGLKQTTENITGDYEVDDINNKIIFNTSKTDPVVSYAYDSQIRVEIGTGKTVTLEKKYIKSKSEAIKLAQQYKARFEDGAQSSKWIKSSNLINNYNVGEAIQVTDTINGYNGLYKISGVSLEYPKKLTIEVGETEDDLFDWQKEAIDRIKQLEEKNTNTDFITKYDYIINNVKVSITTEITKLESYIDDGVILFASDTELESNADIIYDDFLELWLKLDGDVKDYSGNELNASVLISISGSEDYETGLQFDEAFNFVGTGTTKKNEGAYISLPSNKDMDSQNHSLSFWYKTSSDYYQSLFVDTLNSYAGGIKLKTSTNSFEVEGITNNAWNRTFNTGINVDDGEWHHYCFVFSSTNAKLYVDKVLRDTQTPNIDSTGYFRYRIIGGYGNTTYTYGEMPTGQMGDIEIYSEQLTIEQIEKLYNSGNGFKYTLLPLAYDDSAVPSTNYINYL